VAKVYIADVSSTPARFAVNGGATFPGRPVATSDTPAPYTPSFVLAALGRYPDRGVFGYGINALTVSFEDDTVYRVPHRFAISVPETHSIDDALLLYAFRGVVLLLTTGGMPLAPNPGCIDGTSEPIPLSTAPTNRSTP
jgi:hypothetical protein